MNDELRIVVRQIIQWATGQTVHPRHFILPTLIEAIKEIDETILRRYANEGGVEKIISVVFKNNFINWGRIVSVLAFCAMKARLNKNRPDYLLKLEYDFGRALLINVGAWFDSHHGWLGFESFMTERKKGLNWIDVVVITAFVLLCLEIINRFG